MPMRFLLAVGLMISAGCYPEADYVLKQPLTVYPRGTETPVTVPAGERVRLEFAKEDEAVVLIPARASLGELRRSGQKKGLW
jgi:hypothetical protein